MIANNVIHHLHISNSKYTIIIITLTDRSDNQNDDYIEVMIDRTTSKRFQPPVVEVRKDCNSNSNSNSKLHPAY